MLKVEQSNRLETLADRLAGMLRDDPSPPLVPEVVAVPNRGLQRWLAQRLADSLGICASVEFPTVNELAGDCFRRLGMDVPAGREVVPAVVSWAIAGILGEALDEPVFAPVRAYVHPLGAVDAASTLRLHELARRVAPVLDEYVVHRPEWVLGWEDGRSAIPADDPVGPDEAWQAELWRRLVRRIPARGRHFARHLAELRECLRGSDGAAAAAAHLPRRIAVFGTASLAPAMREMLRLLGERIDVRLFLMNPSREYWGDIRNRREIARERSALPAVEGHRLLVSLGLHVRELHDHFADVAEPLEASPAGGGSLLREIQRDILDLRWRGSNERIALAPGDDSILVHVCHTPMREVEVLHDRLLAMFDGDASLRPHDVVVLAPDIEAYAAAIEAVFARRETDDPEAPPWLPYTIADRSASAEQELVATFLQLLAIPGSRFEIDRVLDLLECEAVRRRLGLDGPAVDLAQRWAREANVRWGIDENTARRLGLPPRREHTWRFGLDRLFLGYALSGRALWSPGGESGPGEAGEAILPLEAGEGGDAVALAGLSRLVARLVALDEEFSRPAPPECWRARLSALVDDLFAPSPQDEQAAALVQQAIAALAENPARAGFALPIALDLVRAELSALLASPGGMGRFLAGKITFASLLPLRSVPFRVVCLLGMNSDAFPRIHRPPGFDLLARTPARPGDRSRRDDDRYLFLEALLSARDRLHLSHVGRDVRENSEIPPSVVVSELLDVLLDQCAAPGGATGEDARATAERHGEVRERIEIVHPLQPFSRRYFESAPAGGPLFSYARGMCIPPDGERRPLPLVQHLLAEDDERRIDVADLVRFFRHPPKHFLRGVLGLRLADRREVATAREPLELDDLETFGLRRDLLDGAAGAAAPGAGEEARRELRAAGMLPPGEVGDLAFAEELRRAEEIERSVQKVCGGRPAESIRVDGIEIGDAVLDGSLDNVGPDGGVVDRRPGNIRAEDQLALWVAHLVATVAGRGGPSVFVGLKDGEPTERRIEPVSSDDALEHLGGLVALFRLGRRIPLRLFPSTSLEEVEGGDAAAKWQGTEHRRGDSEDEWNRYAFRDLDPLTSSTAADEMTFADLARVAFGPMVAAPPRRRKGGR